MKPCTNCYQEKEAGVLLPCYVCGVLICKECLDENAAYTYPDSLAHCPNHYAE